MTLRRCDSLPTRLQNVPVPADRESNRPKEKISDSYTVPNFNEKLDRDQVIATWKSLQTDVRRIKNGFPSTNEPALSHGGIKNESITPGYIPAFAYNNRAVRKKITYHNRQTGLISRRADGLPPYKLDGVQVRFDECGTRTARRKTLLQRLLSWKTHDCHCNCREPKLKPEDLLCTCGIRIDQTKNSVAKSERGRSKSVGYEATREVTQFRRSVRCVK